MNHRYPEIEYNKLTSVIERPGSAAPILQLKSIQFVRGIAALLVVSYHLSLFSEAHYGKIEPISQVLGQGYAGVDLFFVVSGFVIAYSTLLESKKKPTLLTYSVKRLIRIFPTYWAMVFLFWIACRVSYGAVPQANRKFVDWIPALFLMPNHLTIIPVSWSLSHELFFYFLIGLAFYSRRLWVVSALVLGGTFYYLTVSKSSVPALWFIFSNYNLEFFGGVVIAFLFRLNPFHRSVYWLILLLSGVWLIVCPSANPDNQDGRILLYGISSMGLIFALTGLERIRQISVSRHFIKLGNASYIIYLLHPSALALLYKFTESYSALPLWAFACLALILIVGVTWCSIVIHYQLEKPLINRLNKFITEKKDIQLVVSTRE